MSLLLPGSTLPIVLLFALALALASGAAVLAVAATSRRGFIPLVALIVAAVSAGTAGVANATQLFDDHEAAVVAEVQSVYGVTLTGAQFRSLGYPRSQPDEGEAFGSTGLTVDGEPALVTLTYEDGKMLLTAGASELRHTPGKSATVPEAR